MCGPTSGALPPLSPTNCTSAASSSRNASTSPSRNASKNRAASSWRSRRSASKRGRPSSMCRRARTASCRHAASDRPTADATSGKPNPNTSRSTNTARSSGLSRSSSTSAAIDSESASSAERSGSSYGSASSGSGNHGPTYCSRRTRAERSTSIEIRVTTADRKALAEVGRVSDSSQRSQASWTASSASATLPRIRYAMENSSGRRSSNSSVAVTPGLPSPRRAYHAVRAIRSDHALCSVRP